MVFSGYLNSTKTHSSFTYQLSIPNYEIQTLFKLIILDWLNTAVKLSYETLLVMVFVGKEVYMEHKKTE